MDELHYRNVIVLRTNIYSKRWNELFSKLPSDIKVLIVKDTRKKHYDYTSGNSIDYNDFNIKELGLMCADDMQWRFGDYALYLADHYLNRINISYDYMWLVEPDLYVKDDIYSFICHFDNNNSDFITSYFEIANDSWMWHKYKKELNVHEVYKTFFPLVRVNRNVIHDLLSRRVKYPSMANDESFVASFVANGKLSVDVFSSHFKYTRNSFSYKFPHYLPFIRFLYFRCHDLYHPAFDSFKEYMMHLIKRSSWKVIIKRLFMINNND